MLKGLCSLGFDVVGVIWVDHICFNGLLLFYITFFKRRAVFDLFVSQLVVNVVELNY